MTTLILFARLFLAAHPAPVQHLAANRPGVTMLDLSGPAEPEGEFPAISAKGRL